MEFAIFSPKTFFNVYGNHREFDSHKNYSTEKLRKFCTKKGKPILKNLLLLDNAILKLRDFYCQKLSEERNVELYKNITTLPGTEKVWLDFITNYQNILVPEIENIKNQLNNLKDKITQSNNGEKYEYLSFYYQSLLHYKGFTIKEVQALAFEKFREDSKILGANLVSIANLYRHAKEYLKLKNMFRNLDLANGMEYITANIVSLLSELKNLDESAPAELKEIQHLLKMVETDNKYLTNQTKKCKVKNITLKDMIAKMDYDYLCKINLCKYIYDFYNAIIDSLIKDYNINPNQKSEFYRKNYVHLTRNYPNLCSRNYSFFDSVDNFKKEYEVIGVGKFKMAYNETDLGFISKKIRNNIMDLTKEIKNIKKDNIDIKESYFDNISFEPYKDFHKYTLDDFFYNTEKVTRKSKNNEQVKEDANDKKSIKDVKINIVNGNETEKQQEHELPTVDPNLPLNERIDQYFSGLIGLTDVKETLLEIISKKILEGKNYKQGQMHMAFLGNPGTGKTTVARIVGRILYENGLINNDNVVEVKFSDLYQNYVGFSAKATREKIKEAEGGVLFIDEAHQLCSAGSDNKDFRKEIINTLIPELENNHNLLVIFAGYSKEMLHMLKGSDKGLFSRVNHRVDFKDFSKNDIMNLFNLEMKKRKNRKDESFELTAEATKMVSNYFDILIKARKDNFANGREVRITIEKILNKFGVIALNREDIKTIDGVTMKQILTSSTFKNEILSDNKNNTVLNIEWEEFSEELSHEN